MNKEGLALLRAVIERDAAIAADVETGNCDVIAVHINGFMPADMQITPVDVHQALAEHPKYRQPEHNAEVLRARIDKIPFLHSARLQASMRGDYGVFAMQTIVNELNLSSDPKEHVTLADVEAAMNVRVEKQPAEVAAGAATMIGTSGLG